MRRKIWIIVMLLFRMTFVEANSAVTVMNATSSIRKRAGNDFGFVCKVNGLYIGEIEYGKYIHIELKEGNYDFSFYPIMIINGEKVIEEKSTTVWYSKQLQADEGYYLDLTQTTWTHASKFQYYYDRDKISYADSYVIEGQKVWTMREQIIATSNVGLAESEASTILHSQHEQTNTEVKQPKNIGIDVDRRIPNSSKMLEDAYVLIFSNERYDYLDNVSYANHDGEIFKEYCVKTLGIPEKQIFYYENATFGKIADGVSKLQYCLNNFEGSKGIVYYCGHGIPDEKTGQAYLIPVDGKGTNMSTCYSLNTLYKTLAATKATSITYFMDACFTGANKEGSMLIAARGVAREPKKEVLAGKSIVFSASSGDETAMTLEEQGHGLFTYYLLKKLQETEGNVTYGELSEYIKRNVQKDAFLINEKPQTPMVATSPAVVNTWKAMKLK